MYEKAEIFKKKLQSKQYLLGVGARDALDARMIDEADFDFVWASSFCISASYSVPDASLISMNLYLEAARSMNQAIEIPVIADCDTGYGNVNNLVYAIKQFEEAGIAGISIEDKKFPKDSSLLEGGRHDLADIDEFSNKIMAAKDTQKSRDFTVIARTEALIAGRGIAEAVKRAESYEKAGADLIFIHSKSTSPDEIIEFVNTWKGKAPLVIVPTNYYRFTEEQISQYKKIKIIIYANQILRSSIISTQKLLSEIKKSKGIKSVQDSISPVSEVFRLQRVPEMKESEKKYK